MIPKKHGFEVCQEIKKVPEGKSTPVIIMTGVYKGRKYRTQAMHVHGCDEYVEKPITPEALLEIVKRFVPPGSIAQAVAVGGGQKGPSSMAGEKLGEVIPFPADRSSYTLHDVDPDAEREIMSKLDEILPDTPAFDQRGLGTAAPSLTGREAESIDFEIDGGGFDEDALLERSPERTEPAGGQGTSSKGPLEDSPRPRQPQSQPQSKKPPKAMKADDVMKLTRSKKRPAKTQEQETSRSALSISPAILVGLVLAIVATVISYLLGRV